MTTIHETRDATSIKLSIVALAAMCVGALYATWTVLLRLSALNA
jgi:hypothetical protein